jgi:chaperonin GroES
VLILLQKYEELCKIMLLKSLIKEKIMSQQTAKKTTLKPLGDRVLIKRVEQEETLKGGIILPNSAKKKEEIGKVVAVGPGKTLEDGKTLPMPVSVGATIIMGKYSGQEVTIDDEEFVIVKADDIIAIINP